MTRSPRDGVSRGRLSRSMLSEGNSEGDCGGKSRCVCVQYVMGPDKKETDMNVEDPKNPEVQEKPKVAKGLMANNAR